jgi:hypothetical protein
MEWLTTPKGERQPPTQEGLAVELACDVRTVHRWMRQADFRADWDREAKTIIGSPERAKEVLDTLYAAATDPRNRNAVQAAKLYLEATNSIRPSQVEVTVRKASELTDEELDALLAQGAVELRRERDGVDG